MTHDWDSATGKGIKTKRACVSWCAAGMLKLLLIIGGLAYLYFISFAIEWLLRVAA